MVFLHPEVGCVLARTRFKLVPLLAKGACERAPYELDKELKIVNFKLLIYIFQYLIKVKDRHA
jgi:hypothetical protein